MEISNLGTIHQQQIEQFTRNQEQIHNRQEQIQRLREEQEKLTDSTQFAEIECFYSLQNQIHQLEDQIDQLKQQIPEQYYLKTGLIMCDYYNNTSYHLRTNERLFPVQSKMGLDRFQRNSRNNSNKADLLQDYLQEVNSHFVRKKNRQTVGGSLCSQCQVEKIMNPIEALTYCPQCGLEEELIIDPDLTGEIEDRENNQFPYKRKNHLMEILTLIQARESVDVPEEVYEMIIIEMKKEGINDFNKLTREKVKSYLKKYAPSKGYNKYYEHISYIINHLNGRPSKIMTPQMEENLLNLFERLQKPFKKHCPVDRRNFLSYNYVLHKLCEYLGYDDFVDDFPLLKSKDKLRAQDRIWKKICADTGITFVSSLK